MKAVRSVVLTLALGVGIAAGASAPALAQQNNPAQCFSKYHVVVARPHRQAQAARRDLPDPDEQRDELPQLLAGGVPVHRLPRRLRRRPPAPVEDGGRRHGQRAVQARPRPVVQRGLHRPGDRGRAGLPDERRRDARHDDLPGHVPGGAQRPRRRRSSSRRGATRSPRWAAGSRAAPRAACSRSSSRTPTASSSGGWVVLPASGEFVRGTSHYGFRVKPVELIEVVGVELQVARREVLLEVGDRRRPRDQQDPLGAGEQPGERDLRRRRVVLRGDAGDHRVARRAPAGRR